MSEKTMETIFDEKIVIALNLIRTNLQGPEAQDFTQAVLFLAQAKNLLIPGKPTPRKQGAGVT